MLLLDTSAVYALADARDPNHERAAGLLEVALAAGEGLLVHSYLISEAANLLQHRMGIDAALAFLDGIDSYQVHWITLEEHDVAVALLSSDSFDVRDVDTTTLAFGPSGAAPRHDLTDSNTFRQHLVPARGGPLKNLISHYTIPETGIVVGHIQACLRGETLDGTLFKGCDSIETNRGGGRRQH